MKIGENKALVKGDIEDRKITIAINGLKHTRRDALSAIRYQLGEIHGYVKGLDAQKRVPNPDAPNAEPLEYVYLLMLEREGQEVYLAKDKNRQGNCYSKLKNTKRMVDIYMPLFADQNQPTDFRAEVGLGLISNVIENRQIAEAGQALSEVGITIRDYDGLDTFNLLFARLWKYRAFVAHAIGEGIPALEFARKSIGYWIKVPDSDSEKKQMLDLIREVEVRFHI